MHLQRVSEIEEALEVAERDRYIPFSIYGIRPTNLLKEDSSPLQPQFPSPFMTLVKGCVTASAYVKIVRP